MNWTPRRSASIRATIYASRCASCSTAKTALPRSTAWCSSPAPLGWRACRRMHRPPQDVEQFICPAHGGGVDLVVMMMLLAKRQVNSIWVEAGASLAGALLQAGLVDELILYIAPKLLGDNGRGLCHLPGTERLADAPEFVFSDVRQVGPDLRLRLRAKH